MRPFQSSTFASRNRSRSPEKTQPQPPQTPSKSRSSTPQRQPDFCTSSVEEDSDEELTPKANRPPRITSQATSRINTNNSDHRPPPHLSIFNKSKSLSSASSSGENIQTPESPPHPTRSKSHTMVQAKIRSFLGLRDGREDPLEFIEDLEFAYDRESKSTVDGSNDTTTTGNDTETKAEKEKRMLFRQHLEGDAYEWYQDLPRATKANWKELHRTFIEEFEVTEKDTQAKKFELRIQLAQLSQGQQETIAEYLKRASELSKKLTGDDIEVGMATLKGMKDQSKKDQVTFECNKAANYGYASVERLIKAIYMEIGKPNPFDPSYRQNNELVLASGQAKQTNEDLMRQALLQASQAFPAMLQGLRSLNVVPQQGKANQQQDYPRPRKDLSSIKCFKCGEYGHYAGAHDAQEFSQKHITANAAVPWQPQSILPRPKEREQDYNPAEYFPNPINAVLPLRDITNQFGTVSAMSALDGAMAAQKATNPSQGPKLQKPKSKVNKGKQPVGVSFKPNNLPQNILDQIEEYNKQQGGHKAPEFSPVTSDDEEEMEILPTGVQETQPIQAPIKQIRTPANTKQNWFQTQHKEPPQLRITKTGKVQELVKVPSLTERDPIRGMANQDRFNISEVLRLPLSINLGQFLDRSDTARRDLALTMQRTTPKYRVKKANAEKANNGESSASEAAIAATVGIGPPTVTAHAQEDDGQSEPLMITSWIGSVKLIKTLIDGGSIVELVNRHKIKTMNPPPHVYSDGRLRVSLATDVITTLSNYVFLPVNVEGIQAVVKAYVVDNQVYDLLLGVPWIRRVAFNANYGTGEVFIQGDDGEQRVVPAELVPIECKAKLPTVEIEDWQDEDDAADAACQIVLDEQQENY